MSDDIAIRQTVFSERTYSDESGCELLMFGSFALTRIARECGALRAHPGMIAGALVMRDTSNRATISVARSVGQLLSWAVRLPIGHADDCCENAVAAIATLDWQRAGDVIVNRYVVLEVLRMWLVRELVTHDSIVIACTGPSTQTKHGGEMVMGNALYLTSGDVWTAIQEGRPGFHGNDPFPGMDATVSP